MHTLFSTVNEASFYRSVPSSRPAVPTAAMRNCCSQSRTCASRTGRHRPELRGDLAAVEGELAGTGRRKAKRKHVGKALACGWRALRNAAKGRFGAGNLRIVRLLTGERDGAASAAAASAAEQQAELGQEDVLSEIGVRAAGVEPAALSHVHAQRDVEEQQSDGDGGGDEQQERVERQQGRREPDSTAGHVELGRVDEQVLQDGEWQQQQQECGGGGGDEEHEKQERPSSVRARTRRWNVSRGGLPAWSPTAVLPRLEPA